MQKKILLSDNVYLKILKIFFILKTMSGKNTWVPLRTGSSYPIAFLVKLTRKHNLTLQSSVKWLG